MAKILHTQTAKSPERTPVDRAAIRKLDFTKRQIEIKSSAQEKCRNIDPGLSFTIDDRGSEVYTNRIKNRVSSISFLAGGQTAHERYNVGLKRDASQKDIENLDNSFGGFSRTNLAGRPMMNRNKSMIEFGDVKTAPGADFYRKEATNKAQVDLLNSATRI